MMRRIIDLSLTLTPGMRGVSFEQAKTVDVDGWNARTLSLYSHSGTHMDAQTHFACGPETVDQIPLDRCMGRAWIARLTSLSPKAEISVEDIGEIAGQLKGGDGLLLHTEWSQHVNTPSVYRNEFQRVSATLAHWMVEQGVKFVGVEAPSVADVNNLQELTRVHQILLDARITIVEGLTNLGALQGPSTFFVAAPLKIDGGDGSPCRAFAIEEGSFAVLEP